MEPLPSPPRNLPPPTTLFNLKTPIPIHVGLEEGPVLYNGVNGLNNYNYEDVIGHDARGAEIYRGTMFPYGYLPVCVAYKRVNLQLQDYCTFVTKINKNRIAKSPYLVHVKEEVNEGGRFWVAFEYIGPSLRAMYPRGASLPVIARALFVVVMALVPIHGNNLVHGDVNAGHIYLSNEHACKLGYGPTVYECLGVNETPSKFLPLEDISYWGSSPEVYDDNGVHTSSSDIWLVGITGLELAIGNIWVKNRKDLFEIINGATVVWEDGVFANEDFKNLLDDCLKYDPELRPTSLQLVHHEFFRNFNLGPGQ